jgi:hypothetical protein
MANSTFNGRAFSLDTIGFIHKGAFRIVKATLLPNAAGDAAVFKSYDEKSTAHSTAVDAATVIAATNLIQSTGNFTAGKVTAGDVIRISASDGAAGNIGLWYVVSRDNDNQITVSGGTMTNETGKTMSWSIYTPTLEFTLKADAATGAKSSEKQDFIGGRGFYNLLLATLGASATVELILA